MAFPAGLFKDALATDMSFRSTVPVLLLAVSLGCSDPDAADTTSPDEIAGRAEMVDGDTLNVGGQRIRLFGIDAPERSQACDDEPCGRQATQALRRKIGSQAVSCQRRDVDRYDRIVAVCYAARDDLGEWLVRNGWAVAYTEYSTDYVDAERDARLSEIGIWQGGKAVEKPWEFRERRRSANAVGTPAPGRCAIKGNISSKGARIFHVPGQNDYGKTRINPGKGERWFCTAEEARAAGWRAARR